MSKNLAVQIKERTTSMIWEVRIDEKGSDAALHEDILTVLEKQTTIPRAAPLPWTTKTTDDEDSFLSTEKETHADGGKFGLAVGRPDSQFPNLNFDRFPWCRKLKNPTSADEWLFCRSR
ncbi:unnamed protein product [Ixodes pacificus]